MVLRIRLSRFGRKHDPFYNIVVSQARIARDSKPIEVLGTYNPVPQKPVGLSDSEAKTARPYKDIALDQIRTKYWLGVGAQPTDGIGLVEPKLGKAQKAQANSKTAGKAANTN
ncbi:ribosomal protein S16 [Trichophyton rubrum MR1459]|nr:ribosomal protein S16 [Trichophyton rubrum MR1459]EZG10439.1 ribosomal protein S16 [Trichophyton rubrum CBS 735.88]KMQ45390.1 Ribosomal protein S16 domain [Trichophyton rubrum]